MGLKSTGKAQPMWCRWSQMAWPARPAWCLETSCWSWMARMWQPCLPPPSRPWLAAAAPSPQPWRWWPASAASCWNHCQPPLCPAMDSPSSTISGLWWWNRWTLVAQHMQRGSVWVCGWFVLGFSTTLCICLHGFSSLLHPPPPHPPTPNLGDLKKQQFYYKLFYCFLFGCFLVVKRESFVRSERSFASGYFSVKRKIGMKALRLWKESTIWTFKSSLQLTDSLLTSACHF